MFQFSRIKAVAWLLLSLSVTVVVTADAFASFEPRAVLPRSDQKRSISPIISTLQSTDDKDGEESEESSSVDNIPRGGANLKKPPPVLPTIAQFRKFAVPCLGLWVAQPLLSLVDTACVDVGFPIGGSGSGHDLF
jgi:hypothetical protein